MKNTLFLCILSITILSKGMAQSYQPIWELSELGEYPGLEGLEVLDVNNDGTEEILITGLTAIYLASFDANGEVQYQTYGTTVGVEDMQVIDLDQDGFPEVFVTESFGNIHVLKAHTLERIFVQDLNTALGQVAVDDIDNDGVYEVFAGGEFPGLRVYHYQNDSLVAFDTLAVNRADNIEIGDIDGDGVKEIVFTYHNGPTEVFSMMDQISSRNGPFRLTLPHSL